MTKDCRTWAMTYEEAHAQARVKPHNGKYLDQICGSSSAAYLRLCESRERAYRFAVDVIVNEGISQ